MSHDDPGGWSRRRWLAGAATAAAFGASSAPARAAPPAVAPHLKRGINLHSLLNWPDVQEGTRPLRYTWPPFASADYQISDAELTALRQAGFDFVRLTADPSIFIVTDAQRRPALERHAQMVVARLLAAGFNIVFDLHPVEVNPAFQPEALVDKASGAAFQAYVDMVGRVAAMLRDFSPARLVLEPFNEPWLGSLQDARRWQAMLEALHARARESDPNRPIVLNGLQWDSVAGLLALDLRPFRASTVLYTFHYYEPHAFTHQGVTGQDTAWLGGLMWPENDGNAAAVLTQSLTRIAAAPTLDGHAKDAAAKETQRYIADLQRTRLGPPAMTRDFESVTRWAQDNAIAPERIVLGEFGCVAAAWGKPLGEDRLRWLEAVRTRCETAGFGWAYWSYKGESGSMTLQRSDGTLDGDTLQALGLTRPPATR